jgi:tRNA-specific 2-thiouridylase
MVDGATPLEAALISIDDAAGALGGLIPSKRHAAQLAADALHRALQGVAASRLWLNPGVAPGSSAVLPSRPRTEGEMATTPAPDGRHFPPTSAPAPERVAVAMSGGVDSAVAALLERERGAEVVAITVKLWADPETDGTKACCSPEAVLGARGLAHSLGMPHFTLDLEEEFRRRVVERFIDGYATGSTPNPCILCNGEVRIAAMLDLAERLGADRLVTGHYAGIVEDDEGPLLVAGADPAKDQSYMLAALPPQLLGRLSFPLTELNKAEVREIAERHGLPVARKAESQDLCFLAGQGKRGFLRRHGGLRDRDGAVLDRAGRTVGRHRGHHNFTVGQRRGIGVSAEEALYVIATDAGANTITVGTRAELETRRIEVRDAVLHRPGERVDAVRLRYHSRALPARVEAGVGRHPRLSVELGEPFTAASPGQTAVLLADGAVVGHGTIVTPR